MNASALHICSTPGRSAARTHTAAISRRRPLLMTDIRKLALHAMGMVLLLGFMFNVAPVHATVMSDFDGVGDTAMTLEEFGTTGSLGIQTSGGNPDEYLRLTEDGIGSQQNFASFDMTDPGTFSTSAFSFDFRVTANTFASADGFSFVYADTGLYGTSGALGAAPYGAAEEPSAAGILGFSFDTWDNGPANDTGTSGGNGIGTYSEISVFWDDALVGRVDETIPLGLTMDDGVWHNVTGLVNFDLGTVSLSVDGIAMFTDLAVAGLAPFESRILLSARTGGAYQETAIDNVLVSVEGPTAVPEPATLWLLLLGATCILLQRGRRWVYLRF